MRGGGESGDSAGKGELGLTPEAAPRRSNARSEAAPPFAAPKTDLRRRVCERRKSTGKEKLPGKRKSTVSHRSFSPSHRRGGSTRAAYGRPPAHACAGRQSHARAGRREEETRAGRRVDPLASARSKKPRRDPDRSSTPTAASCLRHEVDLERRFGEIWRRWSEERRNMREKRESAGREMRERGERARWIRRPRRGGFGEVWGRWSEEQRNIFRRERRDEERCARTS